MAEYDVKYYVPKGRSFFRERQEMSKVQAAKQAISGVTVINGMIVALVVGLASGSFRYWFGYFVLGQALVAGFCIPKLMSLFVQATTGPKATGGFIFFLFACFLIAHAAGFGFSQPWFDPFGWVERVISGDTREVVFGISMFGGVLNRGFVKGFNGGFWIFLNIFDLLFFLFFLTVGINTYFAKAAKNV